MNSVISYLTAALAAALLTACTVVSIEGDGNTISDTGGHGGGIALPTQQPVAGERMQGAAHCP